MELIAARTRFMATDSVFLEKSALEYAGYGWRVIPLHTPLANGRCSCSRGDKCPQNSRGKHPRLTAWQKAATTDEEVIAGWWGTWPDANVGVLLGKDSGLIDLETDSQEGEEMLSRMFDGRPPSTAIFASGRGKHRLFKWSPNLPGGATVPLKIEGKHIGDLKLGNDGKGSQSVFPPSLHWSGGRYKWLIPPDECEPAELPQIVVARLTNWNGLDSLVESSANQRPKELWERLASGVNEGERHEAAKSWIGKQIKIMADPFHNEHVDWLWLAVEAWNEHNRPALPRDELRAIFDHILKAERTSRTNRDYERDFAPASRPRVDTKPEEPRTNGWKVVIRDSKPRTYLLASPLWEGQLELNSGQMLSAGKIRAQALEQKDIWVPKSFDRIWEGTRDLPALGRQLIEAADRQAAEPEQHRDIVVAMLLWDQLRDAPPIEEGQPIDPRGRPQRLADGAVVFGFSRVWRDLAYGPDKVTRLELSACLAALGAKEHRESRRRFHRLTRENLTTLESLVYGKRDHGE